MARFSVLMCSEGTYPHYEGGVSVWCDQLIHALPDVDFQLFAITHIPKRDVTFELPGNVLGMQAVSLWGTQEAGGQDKSFMATFQRKSRTTSSVLRQQFLQPFREAVCCILDPSLGPERLATAFLALHIYFRHFDYSKSMASPEAWRAFSQLYQDSSLADQEVNVHDVTTCMRFLQRFLGVLSVPVPRADITHSSMAGLASIAGVLNKLMYRRPFLLTEHGIYLRELYLSLRGQDLSAACRHFLLTFNEAVVRMNYHFADMVTALGTFNKAWQVRLGASETKIRLTPNGTDPTRFRPGFPSNERPVVLTLARIYRLKGIEYLLRAAALVRPRVPSVIFRILGEPADAEYVRRCREIVAENGLEQNVEWGSTKDPASALSQADLFCLPSVSEGMPYSVLEAMFSGCAVVATDVGNVSEMLDGAGLVVPPADPESLARALCSLLEGGENARQYRNTLATAALKRAHQLYTSEQAVQRFRELYEFLHDEQASRVHTAAE